MDSSIRSHLDDYYPARYFIQRICVSILFIIARSALYFRDPPRETRKSVRSVPLRIIITFHRGGSPAVRSVLVKYVIFEKISSDPRKYRCKVRLAIHNGHHRDPVLDVYFGDFLETYDKKWFCSARVDLWGNVTLSDVGSIQKVSFFGIICQSSSLDRRYPYVSNCRFAPVPTRWI